MALFTKLKQRVAGNNFNFDSLDNIADQEDAKAAQAEAFAQKNRDNHNVSVFAREKPSAASDMFVKTKDAPKVVSVMPTGNDENQPPSQATSREPTYKVMEKKASFRNDQYSVPAPLSARSSQDNRFATSRTNSFTRPPLQSSITEGNTTTQSTLLTSRPSYSQLSSGSTKSQASVSTSNSAKETPAMAAPSMDSYEADDEEIESIFSKVRHNRAEAVIAAIQDGFDANTVDAFGNTMMHVCAQNNHRKLASMLLQQFPTIDVNARNLKGLTPLDYAEKYGFQKVASWLVSVGAVQGAVQGVQTARSTSHMR